MRWAVSSQKHHSGDAVSFGSLLTRARTILRTVSRRTPVDYLSSATECALNFNLRNTRAGLGAELFSLGLGRVNAKSHTTSFAYDPVFRQRTAVADQVLVFRVLKGMVPFHPTAPKWMVGAAVPTRATSIEALDAAIALVLVSVLGIEPIGAPETYAPNVTASFPRRRSNYGLTSVRAKHHLRKNACPSALKQLAAGATLVSPDATSSVNWLSFPQMEVSYGA